MQYYKHHKKVLPLFSGADQQADGDAEMKDGSFTEALTSGTERHSSDSTGKTFNFLSSCPL